LFACCDLRRLKKSKVSCLVGSEMVGIGVCSFGMGVGKARESEKESEKESKADSDAEKQMKKQRQDRLTSVCGEPARALKFGS